MKIWVAIKYKVTYTEKIDTMIPLDVEAPNKEELIEKAREEALRRSGEFSAHSDVELVNITPAIEVGEFYLDNGEGEPLESPIIIGN